MGNPTLSYPGDEPTPCWTCAEFVGLHTYPPISGVIFDSVICRARGHYTLVDPARGCRRWRAVNEVTGSKGKVR